MNRRKKETILFLFLCFFAQLISARSGSGVADSTKKKDVFAFRYNGIGLGYAERTAILEDHLLWGAAKFYFGGRARVSTRKYRRDLYYNPYSRYIEYKFINEYALLAGYRIWSKGSAKLIVTGGPLLRWEKARVWPDKGSGSVPLLWFLIDRQKGDDMKHFGVTASAEIGFMKPGKISGVNLFVFSSFADNIFTGGAAISLLLGRF